MGLSGQEVGDRLDAVGAFGSVTVMPVSVVDDVSFATVRW